VDNRVRELRLERGLTQEQLAALVDVSRRTIISIETGRFDPSLTLAIHLARTFEMPVEELFHLP
jgi:putative transcriptional regulator